MYKVLAFSVLAEIHSKTGQNRFSPCIFRVPILDCLATADGGSLFSASAHVCLRISVINLQEKECFENFIAAARQLTNFFLFLSNKKHLQICVGTARQELLMSIGHTPKKTD